MTESERSILVSSLVLTLRTREGEVSLECREMATRAWEMANLLFPRVANRSAAELSGDADLLHAIAEWRALVGGPLHTCYGVYGGPDPASGSRSGMTPGTKLLLGAGAVVVVGGLLWAATRGR